VANATFREREEYPLINCQSIDRPQQLWQNRSYYGAREDLSKVHSYIDCEPFLSLSQTSSAFLRLLAPTIYSHIAINHGGHNDNAIGQISFLAQLVKTLERQIVRKTVRRITIDFRILHLDTLGSGLNPGDDIDEGWNFFLDLEWENSATPMPDLATVVKSTGELADKLVGLSLVSNWAREMCLPCRPDAGRSDELSNIETETS